MLALAKSIYIVSNLLRLACEKAAHSTANYAQNGPQTIPTHITGGFSGGPTGTRI